MGNNRLQDTDKLNMYVLVSKLGIKIGNTAQDAKDLLSINKQMNGIHIEFSKTVNGTKQLPILKWSFHRFGRNKSYENQQFPDMGDSALPQVIRSFLFDDHL